MDYDYIECGDCLDLMKDIPSGSIDMILCDLPYGTTRNEWDSVIPLNCLWEQYERIIKDNGAILLFAQSPFDKILAMSNIELFRYEWIWEKSQGTGHLNSKKMPLKIHENILVFYRRLPIYNPQMKGNEERTIKRSGRKAKTTNYGEFIEIAESKYNGRYPTDILKFNKDKDKYHPTQKPVALLEYLIKTYTNEGEIVLDNCMGSGSTCVAAVNTGRHYIGFELDPGYFDIACKRLDEAEKAVVQNA